MTVIRDKATPARQAAQTRGRIQKGLDGDKVPGFDPAAAPLETDAEAGGLQIRCHRKPHRTRPGPTGMLMPRPMPRPCDRSKGLSSRVP